MSGNTRLGLAVFNKKSEFSGASAKLWRHNFSAVDDIYRLEPGSTLFMNGKPAAANTDALKEELYSRDEAPAAAN